MKYIFPNYFSFTAGRSTAMSVCTPCLKINNVSISQRGTKTTSIHKKAIVNFRNSRNHGNHGPLPSANLSGKSRKSRPSPHRHLFRNRFPRFHNKEPLLWIKKIFPPLGTDNWDSFSCKWNLPKSENVIYDNETFIVIYEQNWICTSFRLCVICYLLQKN